MASGNFTGSTNNQYITPRILWSSTSNTTANTSDITVTFQLYKSNASSSATSGTGSWTLNINGVAYKFSKYLAIPANNTYVTAYTQTVTGIPHNADGTKSISISVTGGISVTSYTTTSLSGTATLDKIARASSINVSTSMNTGSNLAVTIVPSNSTFRHKVQLVIDGTTKHTSDYIAAGTNSFSYAIPHSWLPTSTSKSMIVRLYTYTGTGTSALGQIEKTITVNVPGDIKPKISELKAGINSGGLSSNYVQGKSTVKLTCSATINGGATVASYAFSGPNLSASSTNNTATSTTITSSGKLTYKVRVTDSRGRYADETVQIDVYPYATPKITSIKAQRCLADGTLDNNGTYARVTMTTSHSAIAKANMATVALSNSKDDYKTGTEIITSTSGSNSYDNVYGSGFLTDETYTIRATITDAYGASNTLIATLASAQRAFNIAKYGNGVAVGGFSTVDSKDDSGLFECNWPMSVSSDLSFSKLDTEQAILFNDGGSEKITTQIYKGAGNSSTVLGAWDMTNNDPIWIYSVDRWFNIYRPTYIRGGLELTETVTAARGRFTSISDASETSQENVPLRIGDPTIQHLDIDANEIIAKKNATNLDVLYLVGSALGLYSGTNLVATIGSDSTGGYIQSAPVYNRTFTGSANMYINSSGTIGRSTASSERYKKDIESVTNEELDPYKILDIPVRQFRYNEENIPVDGKPDDLYIGLIAEEVNNVYPIATEYTEDGQIEMWNIKMLFPALLKIVQDQQKKIEVLEKQINNKAVN